MEKDSVNVLNEFISTNRNYWSNRDENIGNRAIFMEDMFFSQTFIPLKQGKYILAKGIQSKTRDKIIELKYLFSERDYQISRSYGVSQMRIFNVKNMVVLLKAIGMFIDFCKRKSWLNRDVSYIYKEVEIGDLIYDHIIRVTDKNTIDGRLGIKGLGIAFIGIVIATYSDSIFKKITPSFFIASDLIYLNGIPSRYAKKYGAKIIVATAGRTNKMYPDEAVGANYKLTTVEMDYFSVKQNEQKWNDITDIDIYIKEINEGIGDWNIVNAYKNKAKVNKDELVRELGLDATKKNIFIMPHCYSDAPHCSYRALYKDYYDWFENTLKIISQIKSVNWIIKEHPCHKEYNEEGITRKIYDKYKTDNMFYFPPTYSTSVVMNVADAIVTVHGSAGMEMACQGIRCILAGKPYYSGRSYAYTCDSIEEYEHILGEAHRIRKLIDGEIEEAKRTLHVYKQYEKQVDDEYQSLADKYYMDYYTSNYEKNDISGYYSEYMHLIKQNKIKESYLYSWGTEVV